MAMEFKYKFDLSDFYSLVELIEKIRPDIANDLNEIAAIKANTELSETEKNVKLANKATEAIFKAIIKSRESVFELLASTTNKSIEDIKALSMPDAIKCMTGLINYIPWSECLGELKAIIPESWIIKIRSVIQQIQIKAQQMEQDLKNSENNSSESF
jgi:hypothetical protein